MVILKRRWIAKLKNEKMISFRLGIRTIQTLFSDSKTRLWPFPKRHKSVFCSLHNSEVRGSRLFDSCPNLAQLTSHVK